MTDITDFSAVISVTPTLIQIEVDTSGGYQELPEQLEIGSYLRVHDDDDNTIVAVIESYRIKDLPPTEDGQRPSAARLVVDAHPVGRLDENGAFRRGGKQITIPPQHVQIASSSVLTGIYESVDAGDRLSFGSLAQNKDVRVVVDGNRFFGKHIGVVGSTGAGKSCTVARILQAGAKTTDEQETQGVLNNSHIIIFDLHGEYSSAFPEARTLDVDTLRLPYWLMNAEELEEMFIESNEQNSHNQVSQFRSAVIANKARHAKLDIADVSYDAPLYFSLAEVLNYISNLNAEIIGRGADEGCPKLADGSLLKDRDPAYFKERLTFTPAVSSGGNKATAGPFHGEFGRFLMRLEGRQRDRRLDFLLKPVKKDGTEYKTTDLRRLLDVVTGYGEPESNVTIVDLSGIPFEALSVVVSLITRLVFTLSFHRRRIRAVDSSEGEVAFLLVYEEAHNYVPQGGSAKYGSVRRSIERIAKEGRKYGVSLMIVSQRPAEISETVFSQCNNFVAMRLTNPADQGYVRRLLPDNLSAVTDALPTLERGEAVLIGDAIAIPSIVAVDDVDPKPHSRDIAFHTEWQRDWLEADAAEVLERWKQ